MHLSHTTCHKKQYRSQYKQFCNNRDQNINGLTSKVQYTVKKAGRRKFKSTKRQCGVRRQQAELQRSTGRRVTRNSFQCSSPWIRVQSLPWRLGGGAEVKADPSEMGSLFHDVTRVIVHRSGVEFLLVLKGFCNA